MENVNKSDEAPTQQANSSNTEARLDAFALSRAYRTLVGVERLLVELASGAIELPASLRDRTVKTCGLAYDHLLPLYEDYVKAAREEERHLEREAAAKAATIKPSLSVSTLIAQLAKAMVAGQPTVLVTDSLEELDATLTKFRELVGDERADRLRFRVFKVAIGAPPPAPKA